MLCFSRLHCVFKLTIMQITLYMYTFDTNTLVVKEFTYVYVHVYTLCIQLLLMSALPNTIHIDLL